MTQPPPSRFENLPLDVLRLADDVCRRFEAAWAGGGRPHIEDYLADLEEPYRPALLRELVCVEVDHRRGLGEVPLPGEYDTRFPGRSADIAAAFGRGEAMAADDVAVGPDFVPPAVADYGSFGERREGGMGVVWRCRDERLRREVAFKVMKGAFRSRPGSARRFLREARLTALLSHPNIPPVHEHGTLNDGRPFYCMRWVTGRTLAAFVAETPPAERVARLLPVFERVCEALAHAHGRGVIHRDLKPQNVMVGEFGEVLVMDWGLAKVIGDAEEVAAVGPDGFAIDETGTQAGAVMGTFAYMPPEQAAGGSASAGRASDVFGLGAILCAVLTGEPPYSGPGGRELAVAGDTSAAEAALRHCGADAELVALALECMRRDPAGRPADAGEVARRVREYREGVATRLRAAEVEVARREERRLRLRGWLVAGSAVGVVLMATAVVLAVLNARLTDSQERLKESRAREGYDASRIAGQRGAYRKALELQDRAMENGYPDTVDLRLARVRALSALGKADDARDEIDRLAAREDARGRADVLLWQGGMAQGIDEARGEKLLREALSGDLAAAEKSYARALLAETVPDAIAHLRACIEADTSFHAAYGPLALYLLFMGESREASRWLDLAESMSPEEPTFVFARALSFAMAGDQAMAEKTLKGLVGMQPREREMAAAVVRCMSMLGREGADASKLLGDLGRLGGGLFGRGGAALPGPALLRKHLRQLASVTLTLPNVGGPILSMLMAPAEKNLAEAIRVVPSAAMYHLRANFRYGAAPRPHLLPFRGDKSLWRSAREDFLKVVSLPCSKEQRRLALRDLTTCEVVLGVNSAVNDPAMALAAREHLRQLLRLGPVPMSWPFVLIQFALRLEDRVALGELFEQSADSPEGVADVYLQWAANEGRGAHLESMHRLAAEAFDRANALPAEQGTGRAAKAAELMARAVERRAAVAVAVIGGSHPLTCACLSAAADTADRPTRRP